MQIRRWDRGDSSVILEAEPFNSKYLDASKPDDHRGKRFLVVELAKGVVQRRKWCTGFADAKTLTADSVGATHGRGVAEARRRLFGVRLSRRIVEAHP